MTKNNKLPIHTTPVGTAIYPRLNRPDTKYNKDGVYHVKMLFDKNSAKKLSDVIKPLMNGGKNNPLKPEVDDQGNKTGNYVARFEMKAKVVTRDDSWEQKPILLDSVGNRMVGNIGGGSKLQIAYQAAPYPSELQGGGVKLRLKKVRVIDFVEYQDKNNTDWGDVEGNYVEKTEEQQDWEAAEMVEDEDEEDF